MKIGIIGAGKMAQALIHGLLNNHYITADHIYVTGSSISSSKKKAELLGVRYAPSNAELIETCDWIILGVKPHAIIPILSENRDLFVKNQKIILSLAAGISLASMEDATHEQQKIVRLMPNIAIEIGQSTTALVPNKQVNQSELDDVTALVETVGQAYLINEPMLPAFTGIAGCSPAFIALFIEGLARAGVKNGIAYQEAVNIAISATKSTTMLMSEKQLAPNTLIQDVCSPGGTTIEGVTTLEDERFIPAIVKAVDATISKDYFLSKKET